MLSKFILKIAVSHLTPNGFQLWISVHHQTAEAISPSLKP